MRRGGAHISCLHVRLGVASGAATEGRRVLIARGARRPSLCKQLKHEAEDANSLAGFILSVRVILNVAVVKKISVRLKSIK